MSAQSILAGAAVLIVAIASCVALVRRDWPTRWFSREETEA